MKHSNNISRNQIARERLYWMESEIARKERKKENLESGRTQDTIIRKDINESIIKMLKKGENSISIKIYLTNKYPDRIDYIIKMLKYHDEKINKNAKNETKNIIEEKEI